MELSKDEKRQIFYALLHDYPQYDRGRMQSEKLFKANLEKRKRIFESIGIEEKKAYKLLEKFAKEIGQELPKYVEPIFETGEKN